MLGTLKAPEARGPKFKDHKIRSYQQVTSWALHQSHWSWTHRVPTPDKRICVLETLYAPLTPAYSRRFILLYTYKYPLILPYPLGLNQPPSISSSLLPNLLPSPHSTKAMVTQTHSNSIKFLCSYGGKMLPRSSDGALRYVGGLTRVLAVNRSVSFAGFFLSFLYNLISCKN